MADNGRSQAQDKLARQIAEAFPFSHVEQEVFINRIIEMHGYTVDEIRRELGHKPHKMFVDIYMRTSNGDYAFEYNGEQHYAQVGNMTATKMALDANQMLDREKAWILTRIGVPIVQVPYDAYIDESVLDHLIEEASKEVEDEASKMYTCDICGRSFPGSQLVGGLCKACQEREQEKQRRYAEEQRQAELADRRGNESDDEYKERMRQRAKELRKERYRQMKESPEYQRMKAEAKERRRAAYQEQKRKMNEMRKAQKEARRNAEEDE